MTLEYAQCKKCGCLYEDGDIGTAFRLVFARNSSQKYRRKVCIVCEQRERDDRKWRNRFRRKVRNTLNTHYKKYKRLGFRGSKQDFAERYGWNLDLMEADLRKAHEIHKCHDCRFPYRVLDDISLDIREPDKPPLYGSYEAAGEDETKGNTEWICRTCNSAKGNMPMAQWRKKQRIFQICETFLEKLNRDPFYGTLFEGLGAKVGRKPEWNGETWE